MTEEERERAIRNFRGKTINRAVLMHEDEEGFNDVISLEFSDMSKVSFTLHGELEAGPE